MPVITLEAPIAAGKSTLLQIIKEAVGFSDVVVVQEPVHEWQNVNGSGNLLDLFYTDMKRYAYTFESFVLVSRVTALQKVMREHASRPNTVFVMERSWESSRHVFGELTWASSNFTPLEWELYKQTHEYVSATAPRIDGHIFLHVSADVAVSRLKKRSRSEESTIPFEYQQALEQKHVEWLGATATPVLTVDGNQEFENDPVRRARVVQEIRDFITARGAVLQTPVKRPERVGFRAAEDKASFEMPSPVSLDMRTPKRRCLLDPDLDVQTPLRANKLMRRGTY